MADSRKDYGPEGGAARSVALGVAVLIVLAKAVRR